MRDDRRLEAVRRLLKERRAVVEPDPHFASRVVARLPRRDEWMLAWAARRVVPVTLAVAGALTVAVILAGRNVPRAEASASNSGASSQQKSTDPLEWLLESGRDVE